MVYDSSWLSAKLDTLEQPCPMWDFQELCTHGPDPPTPCLLEVEVSSSPSLPFRRIWVLPAGPSPPQTCFLTELIRLYFGGGWCVPACASTEWPWRAGVWLLCSSFQILALCHIAVGQQMNLHWLHKVNGSSKLKSKQGLNDKGAEWGTRCHVLGKNDSI